MADKMIFPIGFDLEAAVKQAQGDADRLLRKLETTIKSRPLAVNLKIGGAADGSIDAINKRMSELVKQWNKLTETERIHNKTSGEFTPQAKKIIAEYVRLTGATESYARSLQQLAAAARRSANEQEKNLAKQRQLDALLKSSENSIASVTAKLQYYKKEMNAADVGSAQFSKAASEVKRLTTRLTELQTKVQTATGIAKKQVNSVTQEMKNQEGYVSRLIKRLAVYAGFQQISNLLTSIRDVTAEFELQRVSLGAIIQDQQKANELFSEIKAFALKSPLKILDLTKYTKQVAAYRIEQDKLFDTTRRLADVSVGLGVDMGRIVLAYGQVKAASYLRAAEIRQFTEAGIPMLELLAEKFTELQGSVVSTEEVMDKVSKRMVAFSMVEEIFNDMTSAGGMFYNMQEKQSQTLYGMWAKLGDAASLMYEQMGNTAVANQGMKAMINAMQDMFLHWTALANVAQTAVIGFGMYKAAMAGLIPAYNMAYAKTINQTMAEKRKAAAMAETMAIGRAYTQQEARSVATKNEMIAADYKKILTENKYSAAKLVGMARQAAYNAELRQALIDLNLFSNAQITAIGKMSKWQFFLAKLNAQTGFWTKQQVRYWNTLGSGMNNWRAKLKLIGSGIANVFNTAKTAITGLVAAYGPLIGLTAVIDLFMDWRNAVAAQEEAVKKVDKQYEEMKVTLMEIENAYHDIQNAAKDASVSEDEFIKTSYSQKLEQLKKVIKLLGNFGMKNVIDPSVLNYTNIDPVLDKWLAKLNEVNEVSVKWGKNIALVSNAFEANVLGWSLAGENLNEDFKDADRAWMDMTVNPKFTAGLREMRALVDNLANDNKETYDYVSKMIGADAKLALQQKRRNESDYEYQQRIYKAYRDIYGYISVQNSKSFKQIVLPTFNAEDAKNLIGDFEKEMNEVMHEIKKTLNEDFYEADPLTLKMAIDDIAAQNEWENWKKEAIIKGLNKIRVEANLAPIPTDRLMEAARPVAEGLKSIIATEFPNLFTENDLKSLVSVEGIVDAIEGKLKSANDKLDKAAKLQNNIGKGSAREKILLAQIDKLQKEISDITAKRAELNELNARKNELTSDELERHTQLTAELQDTDNAIVQTNQAKIAALVQQNDKYNEQIENLREIAKAERDAAKAALERVTSSGLSSLGEDVKQEFPQLVVNEDDKRENVDYFSRYLISDDELKKITNVVDLYELWAKQTKAIADDKKKMVGVGMTEEDIAKSVTDAQAKRVKDEQELADVNRQIANSNLEKLAARYDELVYARALATTTAEQQTAEANLGKFLKEGVTAEAAKLFIRRQNLNYAIREGVVAENANQQILDNIAGMENAEKFWEELGKRYNFKLPDKDSGHGGGEDPWIILMKNRMKFMQDFQKGVEDLSKWMGYTKGLADEQENMLGRGLSVQIDSRELDGSKEELIKWYEDSIEEIRKRIAKMGGKEWEGLGVQMILAKDTKSRVIKKYQELLQEMWKNLTDFRTDQAQKALEAQLKSLADRISRTKTAKEFYEKILGQTGDVELAATLSFAVYGEDGEALKQQIIDNIAATLGTDMEGVQLDFTAAIRADKSVDYDELVRIAEGYRQMELIADETVEKIKKMRDEDRKDLAKTVEGWLKATEKAKTYSDKLLDLARTTNNEIAEINKQKGYAQTRVDALLGMPSLTVEEQAELSNLQKFLAEADTLIQRFKDKQKEEEVKLGFEAFKDSPMYVQMFDDLDHASTRMLENMKARIEGMQGAWKDLDPTQLKELQGRLNEIDKQLARRNPFKGLVDGIKKYRKMGGRKGEKAAEQTFIDTAKAADEARKKYEDILHKDGATKDEIAQAKKDLDDAMADKTAAQKAVENWKKVKDTIGLSANELFLMLNWAGDIAKGIADISEAMGADEEDVQYWNDVASALNEVAGGIQDIVSAAMSGNVVGIISSVITAVPKMFVGFVNLFSAGKIRNANKEIKRQGNLLERLEYTYSRLEKVMEKTFGGDYISNFNQQLKNLQAQAAAYQKQYDAEKSKGKKADDDKLKEYQNSYRDTMNEIADMQGQIAEKFTGTSRQDVARQMAKSWVEARASLSDTFAAIKGDYSDMIKNMIVEGAAARVIEQALTPMWDKMDKMLNNNDVDGAIDALVNGMDSALNAANNGMEALWRALESRGYNLKELLGDTDTKLTGISRDIASASEEQITGLAATMNTWSYYVSFVPGISADVAAIRQFLERGTATAVTSTATAEWTDWQQQAMDNYVAIQRNTADTVVECRRIAASCADEVALLKRVITQNPQSTAYGIKVFA